MSWSASVTAAWQPGYAKLPLKSGSPPAALQLPDGSVFTLSGTKCALECLSMRRGELAIGFSRKMVLCFDVGWNITEDCIVRIGCEGSQDFSKAGLSDTYITHLEFSGHLGEMSCRTRRNGESVGAVCVRDSDSDMRQLLSVQSVLPDVCLPAVLGPEGSGASIVESACIGVDEVGMLMISSILGTDLLGAEIEDVPELYVYRWKPKGMWERVMSWTW